MVATHTPPPSLSDLGLMQGASPPGGDVCLEARIATADPRLVLRTVERWLGRHEASPARLDDQPFEVRYSGDATFYLQPSADGTLSVFLHAAGADAARTLAWYSSDLLGAVFNAGGDIDVTWVRHPCVRERNRIRYG